MTDKELLELAAKAADYGFFFNRKISDDAYEWKSDDGMLWQWNPLMDDGQALRLAVKLGFCMTIDLDLGGEIEVWEYGSPEVYENSPINDNPYAATRRTIVRAAAEIGKNVPRP